MVGGIWDRLELLMMIQDFMSFWKMQQKTKKKKLFDLVAQWMGFKKEEKEEKKEKTEGMMPVEVREIPIPKEAKKVASIRVPKMISTKKVFWDLYNQLDQVSEENRGEIVKVLISFMRQYMMKINHTNVKTFFLEFEPVFHRILDQVLNAEGYSELKDYLETEGDEKINSLLLECKKNLNKIIV